MFISVVFDGKDQLMKDDIKVYAAVLDKPGGSFLNAGKWSKCVSSHLASRFVSLLDLALMLMGCSILLDSELPFWIGLLLVVCVVIDSMIVSFRCWFLVPCFVI